MDPLLSRCRALYHELAPEHADIAFARRDGRVAAALWTHVRAELSPPSQNLLVRVFDRDIEAKDDSLEARRRKVDADFVVRRLLAPHLALEIRWHERREAQLAFFLSLAQLDFTLACRAWEYALAPGVTREEIASVLVSPSRTVREWAMGELRKSA